MAYHDSFGRAIDYLRISITDRCNLRCVYCMPEEGVPPLEHEQILRYEEIARLARIMAAIGVSKLRISGGEPLTRKGAERLVAMLAGIPGVDDLAMTTNGTLLAGHAARLAQAGLKRVNVSLDSLRPERFQAITRRGRLEEVFEGLAAAKLAGLAPIKINVVAIRGVNDDEAVALAQRTLDDGWHIRFIEVMPLGSDPAWARARFIASAEIRARLESVYGPLRAVTELGAGPAQYYQIPGASGSIGFISPLSEHFCSRCNRLRLTAHGQLVPCLASAQGFDLRSPLRTGAGDDELRDLILQAIEAKPAGHRMATAEGQTVGRRMSRTGG